MIKDNQWWLRGKFYSLYIDKFADNIPDLIDKLPYFSRLGIDCLHILPHYPSPMCDGGYDITNHTGVRPELGTVEDFKKLCSEAHKLNIRIMVDLVLNHTSDQHPWFIEARNSKDSPKRNFYIWSETGTEFKGAPNPFTDFKDSNWIWNEPTKDYYFATFKPCQPELNWANPEVLKAMLDIVDELVAQGVDGFRLDAIIHLVEQEGTDYKGTSGTHEAIKKVRSHLDKDHTGKILLGEVIGTTDFSRGFFGESDECHLSYNFELMNEIIYSVLTGDTKDKLRVAVEASRKIPPNASWMTFLRNHDSLILSTLDEKRRKEVMNIIDPYKKYPFNHGQETPQRLFNVLNKNEKMVRDAFAILYSIPSASVMYYGDEIGMQNAELEKGEVDMRFISRGKFDWHVAEKQMKDPHSLFNYVRALIGN